MQHTSELKCIMSRRDWGLALGGVVLLAVAFAAGRTAGVAGEVLAGVAAVVGLGCLAWVLLGRRVRLRANGDGLTYQKHLGAQSITWKRLSSLQFKVPAGRETATTMVVVNDMGRKEMHVSVGDFGARRLHDFVAQLPTRSTGRQRLLP